MMLRRGTLAVVVMVALSLAAAAAADLTARAVALYEAGDYPAALPLLEQIAAEGTASGAVLYRLAFARGRSGDAAGAAEAQARALVALEREVAGGGDLESAFYLSNAYRNAGRAADSREVAAAATTRIAAGDLAVSDDPVDLFRAGKLYEDLGRHEEVAVWYGRAVEAMRADPARHLGYLRWALRHLGNLAFARTDYAEAERRFAALTELDDGSAQDWDLLGTARARMRDWPGAADAWSRSERADPINGNRARYCQKLAAQAMEIGSLPETLPDGRAIASLGKEELEAVMTEQAGVVAAVRQERESSADPPSSEANDDARRRLAAARGVFVAAAMEYSVRNLPIRETAFFGGYAPLIFHGSRWAVDE